MSISAAELLKATSHFSATCREGEEHGDSGFDVVQAEPESERNDSPGLGGYDTDDLHEQWDAVEAGSAARAGGSLCVGDFIDDEVIVIGEQAGRKRSSSRSGVSGSKKPRRSD